MRVIMVVLMAASAIALIGLIVWAIPREMDRSYRAHEMAKAMGCTVIGSPRDLNSVKFFQCGNDVIMRRVE